MTESIHRKNTLDRWSFVFSPTCSSIFSSFSDLTHRIERLDNLCKRLFFWWDTNNNKNRTIRFHIYASHYVVLEPIKKSDCTLNIAKIIQTSVDGLC